MEVYVTGGADAGTRVNDGDIITIVQDRDEFAVDDDAALSEHEEDDDYEPEAVESDEEEDGDANIDAAAARHEHLGSVGTCAKLASAGIISYGTCVLHCICDRRTTRASGGGSSGSRKALCTASAAPYFRRGDTIPPPRV